MNETSVPLTLVAVVVLTFPVTKVVDPGVSTSYDGVIELYVRFSEAVTKSPLVLTDASTEAKMRKYYGSSTAVSFASTVTSPDLGIISISLTGTQSISLKPGRYVYDVKISNSGREYKAVEGTALVRGGVTR